MAFFFPVAGLFVAIQLRDTVQAQHENIPRQRNGHHPGVVKSRNALMELAYDGVTNVDARNIDSHVKRLRKKFMASDSEFDSIQTLYGVGYRFKET